MRALLLVLTLGLFVAPGALFAQEASQTLSPYFFIEGPAYDDTERFPLESTDVAVTISGVVADVTVKQVYRNDGTHPINARYVFPASTRAAVHGMQLQIGAHRVVAKIKEREAAAEEFREATEAGKSASLLEQERPNVFTMSVANIMPGDRIEAELRYSELLVPSEGVYSFVYPTVVGPRYSSTPAADAGTHDQFVATPYLPEGDTPPTKFAIRVDLSTGVPLAELQSATHEVDLKWDSKSVAHVVLRDPTTFSGNRDFVLDYRLAGQKIDNGLLIYEGGDETCFLLMLQPPARVEAAAIPAREYVFVLDVSGSMHGFPLDTAKLLMTDLITQLRPTDTFNIVLFSGDSYTLAETSLPATQANVEHALDVIHDSHGGGGTELEAALRRAHALPRTPHVSRSVVVVTDGYISEERGAFESIAKHLNDTNLFAFGIGSGVNRYLIEGLARTGQGEPFIVTDPNQAKATAERFRRYIESPVLTGIEVRFKGVKAYDIEPRVQPDLFAERPVVVLGKLAGRAADYATGRIEVTGHSPAGPFASSVALADAASRPENSALPRLWARTRIAKLSDFNVGDADAQSTREVTALGLQYSLLTKHTSFIAVLEQIRNPDAAATDVAQPLPLPQGVSNMAVGGGDYAAGAEPELLWLLVPMLAYLVLTSRRGLSRAVRT